MPRLSRTRHAHFGSSNCPQCTDTKRSRDVKRVRDMARKRVELARKASAKQLDRVRINPTKWSRKDQASGAHGNCKHWSLTTLFDRGLEPNNDTSDSNNNHANDAALRAFRTTASHVRAAAPIQRSAPIDIPKPRWGRQRNDRFRAHDGAAIASVDGGAEFGHYHASGSAFAAHSRGSHDDAVVAQICA